VHRSSKTTRRRPPSSTIDTTLGAVFFVLAACAFVVLCVIDGFNALTAHGVDVRRSDAEAARTIGIAAWTWWPGLCLAIVGPVGWIVRARQRRPTALWAMTVGGAMVALVLVSVTAGGP
jgi:hypothetical protein